MYWFTYGISRLIHIDTHSHTLSVRGLHSRMKFVTNSCMEFGDPSDMTRKHLTRLRIAFTCGVRDSIEYRFSRLIWYMTRERPTRWRLAFAWGVRDAFRNGVRDSFTYEVLKIICVEPWASNEAAARFHTWSLWHIHVWNWRLTRSKLIHIVWNSFIHGLRACNKITHPLSSLMPTHHRVSQIQNNNLEATKAHNNDHELYRFNVTHSII